MTNLLLVRAGERTRELGVRSALGAGVRRLRRLLLLESALLALVAGALGAVVGLVTIRLLTSFTLPGGVVLDRAGLALDARALTFTAVLSMLTALAFGLLPAVHAARQDAAAVLRQGAGRTSGPRPRALFVTAQVAISLVLLTGATLFLRSVNVGLSTDLGFDPDPLVALDVHPRLVNYGSRTLPFYEEAVARVSALPGVTAAAATSHLPLQRATILPFSEVPPPPDAGGPGLGVASSGDTREIGIGAVSPGYFATIGVRMVDGRGFASTDRADTEKVVVLNRAAATLFWPGRSAIRQRLYLLGTSYTVVGVVENTKYSSLADSEVPFAYTALAQESLGRATLVARTVDRVQVLEGLQREVREVGPGVPITDPRFVRAQIDTALMPQRFAATLLSIFGAVALCIAAVGLYASVAYAAVSRTAEIGIRLALGAQRSNIVWLLLRHAGAALLVGMLIGVPCALLAAHALRHFLFGIGTRDPASLASAAAVLVLGGMICSVLPAVRAARANALRLLRVDE